MLLILAILFLLATPLTVLGLRRARARMGAQWLLAAVGALLAWASLWLLRSRLPLELTLLEWSAAGSFIEDPGLLADATSWPFALALATLALATILTGIGRLEDLEAGAWTGSLAISALGILAVLAGNPLTLALAWTVLDVVELVLLLVRMPDALRRRNVVVHFATSLLGTFLLLYADALALNLGAPLTFAAIPAGVGLPLFLAAGLRLGVLPLHLPFVRDPDLRRGLGSILRLTAPAASLVLLVRVAGSVVFEPLWLLQALLALTALYAAIAWARLPDELVGRPFWILGTAALAFAAALQGDRAATLAWSLLLLLPGGVLFFSGRPGRWRRISGGLALLAVLGLPLTPGAAGVGLYEPFHWTHLILLPAHALLFFGYLRHVWRPLPAAETPAERWIQAVHPGGLLLVLASYWLAGWPGFGLPPGGWALAAIVLIGSLLALLARRGPRLPAALFEGLDRVFSLRWLFVLLGRLLEGIGRIVRGFNRLLEGESGMLWALLLVALLLSVLSQLTGGGG